MGVADLEPAAVAKERHRLVDDRLHFPRMEAHDDELWMTELAAETDRVHPRRRALDRRAGKAPTLGLPLQVREELRFGPILLRRRVEVGEVHPNRWRDGTFAMWHRYYEHFGEQPLPRVVQLIPSENQFCSHHAQTRRIDASAKRLVYESFGVPSYWIVGPDAPSVTVLELRDGTYVEAAAASGSETASVQSPFPLSITPSALCA